MYTTQNGAKARAKELKRLFEDSSFHFPLHRCQAAIARAGGFQDWHDLGRNLRTAKGRPIEIDTYRRRLKAALPLACQGPLVESWNPNPDAEDPPGDGIPPNFFRDAWPYVMAAEILYRTSVPLIRPGSGKGQQLRQAMVCGVLMNIHGGYQSIPTLDPDTLHLDYPGDLASVFREEAAHPRFAEELETLTEAGILAILDDPRRGPIVRVLAPDGLQEEVARRSMLSVEYAAQVNEHDADDQTGRGLTRAIHEALSALGVDDTLRVAQAIRDQHAPEYATPSGAMLALLADFARGGRMEAFAQAYRMFTAIHPMNATFVGAQAPAMVGSYLAASHGVTAERWIGWLRRNPDWGIQVREALTKPARFEALIAATVTALSDSESRAA